MSNSTLMPVPTAYLEEYNGSTLVGIAIAFTVLEVFFVLLRFIARRIGDIKLAAEDALVIPALVLCIAINAVAIAMVQYAGVGHHLIAILEDDPSKIILWAKFLIVESFLYLVAVILPKLAILCIYIRVFPTKPVLITSYILGAIMLASSITSLFFAGLGCIPMEYFWDKTIPGGHCVNIHALYMWASFPNIITDLVMLILPLPMIWTLHIPPHLKLGLTFTFLTGSIGLSASILRFESFTTIDPLSDGTWASVTLMTWTIVEPGAYLIAACLPTLRPLVVRFWETGRQTISKTDVSKRASNRVSQLGGLDARASAAPGMNGRWGGVALQSHFGRDADYFELVEKGEKEVLEGVE